MIINTNSALHENVDDFRLKSLTISRWRSITFVDHAHKRGLLSSSDDCRTSLGFPCLHQLSPLSMQEFLLPMLPRA
jgi:hypothetical protein